jgi:pyruvate kinase
MRRAKIVCTLGPATSDYEKIRELVAAGMDVARLNLSHGAHDTHRRSFESVRRAAREMKKPVAILADLSGPKIRLGDIEGGEVPVRAGEKIVITIDKVVGNRSRVGTNYTNLPREVEPGTAIFIDDGRLKLVVLEVAGNDIHCEIHTDGMLGSRKGLNIPDATLSVPALTEKDKGDIVFGREIGVDYFALSFVRRPEDVTEAKRLAGDIPIIAKIEKPQAVARLEEIASVADGLMVARGDLGIEVGFERVPMLQKQMIRAMNDRAKPVITATQMLESMVHNPRPTRAEVSDVANAILDGTDAVMLSGETAAGKFPIEAARTMAGIVTEVERAALAAKLLRAPEHLVASTFRNAIAHAAARCAVELKLKAVAVYSETGVSAALVSAYRPTSAIAAFSRHPQVLNRMALLWGVVPISSSWAEGMDDLIRQAESELIAHRLAIPGDEIVVTFGLTDGGPPGTTILKLWKVRG